MHILIHFRNRSQMLSAIHCTCPKDKEGCYSNDDITVDYKSYFKVFDNE